MLGGDEAKQAALLCPGKGTEGEDGPGRKALNQRARRGKEAQKRQAEGRGKRRAVLRGGLPTLRAYPGRRQTLGP